VRRGGAITPPAITAAWPITVSIDGKSADYARLEPTITQRPRVAAQCTSTPLPTRVLNDPI
jgi:hypothetical protein